MAMNRSRWSKQWIDHICCPKLGGNLYVFFMDKFHIFRDNRKVWDKKNNNLY